MYFHFMLQFNYHNKEKKYDEKTSKRNNKYPKETISNIPTGI